MNVLMFTSLHSSFDSLLISCVCVWRRWSMRQTGTEMERWTSRSSCALWRKPACTEGSARNPGLRRRGEHVMLLIYVTSISKCLLTFLCRAIPLNYRRGFNCLIVHWKETVRDPSIKAWSNAKLSSVDLHNYLQYICQKQREKTLPSCLECCILLWRIRLNDINGFYVVMRFSVPTVTNTFQCFLLIMQSHPFVYCLV